MPYLDVPGGKLHYETAGEHHVDKLPLVLIHAGIATLRMWDDQLSAFAPDRLVVRYDTRGFGQTVTEDVPFSDRDDLLALLDHLSIERVAVIGCSRGGQIALEFTLEHPERVGALVTSALRRRVGLRNAARAGCPFRRDVQAVANRP